MQGSKATYDKGLLNNFCDINATGGIRQLKLWGERGFLVIDPWPKEVKIVDSGKHQHGSLFHKVACFWEKVSEQNFFFTFGI